MKTSECLKTIYDEAYEKLGHDKARRYLTSFFSNMIFDLEESNNLTADAIETKIMEEAVFIKNCKKEDAA